MFVPRISPVHSSRKNGASQVRPFSTETITPVANVTKLPNGLTVATLSNKDPITSVSVYVGSGSRNDKPEYAGTSFFLKSMGFRATQNRTAIRLVREFEFLAANYTVTAGREHIAYTAELPSGRSSDLVPILADVLNPRMLEFEVKEEKKNVKRLVEDATSNPHNTVYELLHQTAYRNKGLGQSLYTPSYNVGKFTPEVLRDHINTHYTSNNTVVFGVGGVKHEEFVELARVHFDGLSTGPKPSVEASKYTGGEALIGDSVPTHMGLAFEGAALNSKDFCAMGVLQFLLGGGTRRFSGVGGGQSSRLGRNVAKNSWVEYVNAFNFSYSDSGIFGVVAQSDRGHAGDLVKSVTSEMKKLTSSLTSEELQRAKALFKSSVLFSTDRKSCLADFVGNRVSLTHQVQTPEDVLRGVDSITEKDVLNVAKRVFSSKPTLVVLGDVYNVPTVDEIQSSLK